MVTKILAIDPGKDGFIALLVRGTPQSFWPMPVIKPAKGKGKRQYNDAAMAAIVREVAPDILVVEKQQAMRGPKTRKHPTGQAQGASSTFSTGVGFGIWRGIAAGMGLRIEIPHPKTWQAAMLRDVPGKDTKARSIVAAGRRFPMVDLRRTDRCSKPHNGKADALLIAAWAQDKFGASDA